MPSRFSERLDFLMSLTNTTNSALARELAFDASYISRIRNGKRGMPLHQPFVDPAAAYLASRVREPYQIQTVEQALHLIESWPTAREQQAHLIASWLTDNTTTLDAHFDQLFESLSSLRPYMSSMRAPEPNAPPKRPEIKPLQTRFFMGNQGRRDATELFLSELLATGKPQTLLTYSDENLKWFIEDPAFTRRWMTLMAQLIGTGSTVTIVHTLTRNLGEMLDAVRSWLPLYLTGRITSYYCPHIRDGICRRTLFVASGTAAISSNSIEDATEGMSGAIVGEPSVVKSYEREFNNLLALCKPLVKVTPLSDDLSAECAAATFVAAHPTAAKHISAIKLPVEYTERLPEDVVAFVNENDSFILAHLANPRLTMHVTERLLAAAFAEYLR